MRQGAIDKDCTGFDSCSQRETGDTVRTERAIQLTINQVAKVSQLLQSTKSRSGPDD